MQIAPLGVAIYFNVPAILVIVLLLGILVGAVNGLLITRFNVAPFIATLGTLYVARGAAQLSNNGATFQTWSEAPELGNTGFPILGAGTFLGIPIVIWIMILFAGVGRVCRFRDSFWPASLRGREMSGRPNSPASMSNASRWPFT